MEYRAPSTLVTANRMLRRRSGACPPQYSQPEDDSETHPVDDSPDHLERKPTVLLLRRAPSPPLPALPRLSSRSVSPPLEPEQETPLLSLDESHHTDSDSESTFRSSPKTHRPDGPRHTNSEASIQTTTSTLLRLPTPDFTRTPQPTIASFFSPFGLSFLPRARPPLFSRSASRVCSEASEQCSSEDSAPSRTPSERSAGSSDSLGSSSNSIDAGHRALIQGVGTTDKFTHKWPRPQSLRDLEERVGKSAGVTVLEALEDGRGLGMGSTKPWTGFKWCLFFSVCTVFAYGTAGLVCALMTWFRTWGQADVMYVADNDVLILITLAASILIFTALVGMTGTLLNSRPILAVYTLLLWPAFAALLVIGYTSYKRSTFSLENKLNLSWSQYYTPLGRLLIQDSLHCCGYYNALHEATPSKRCYPRTMLPGCKGKLYRFESANLELVWSSVFSLVPLHLVNVLVALLCANHITYEFGKGITPEKYRLTSVDVKEDAKKLLKVVGYPRDSSAVYNEYAEDRLPLLQYESREC
ncbi:tetraspanin Tsp2 family [Mycena rebaudengoi]|nr:tetraspanin Tsp2 family [Mycena rebaudengoi]